MCSSTTRSSDSGAARCPKRSDIAVNKLETFVPAAQTT